MPGSKIFTRTCARITSLIAFLLVWALVIVSTVYVIKYTVHLRNHDIELCTVIEIGTIVQICPYGNNIQCGTYTSVHVNNTTGHEFWIGSALCIHGVYSPSDCFNLYCQGCEFWCQQQVNGEWLITKDRADKNIWSTIMIMISVFLSIVSSSGVLVCILLFRREPAMRRYDGM